MKKLSFGLTVLLLFSICANAQLSLGIKGGLNLADVSLKINGNTDFDGTHLRVAPRAGIFAEIKIIENLYVQPNLLITGKGYKALEASSPNVFSKYTPMYIEMPIFVMGKFDIGDVKLYGGVGPYVSYGIAGKLAIAGDNEEIKIWSKDFEGDYPVKKIDAGASLMLGIQANNFLIGVQYDWGIINTLNTSVGEGQVFNKDDYFRNRVLSLNIGYVLFGGGDPKKNAHKRYKRR